MKYTTIRNWSVILCMASLPIFTTSCNKMLDIKPTDQVDGEDIFKSLTTVNRAVLGVYAGWEPEYTLRIGSVTADECVIGTKNAGVNGSAQNLFRWAFTGYDPEIVAPWTNAYQVINRVNRILEGLPKVPAQNKEEEQQKIHLQSELLAIRAFEHFELYRMYGSAGVYNPDAYAVPYVTTSDINAKPARPTVAAFFKALEQDLTKALENSDEATDITRMNQAAMYALQARVALYTNNWTSALENADKATANNKLAERTEFPGIWTDKNNAEVIFKLKRTNQSAMRPGDIWKNASLGIVYFAPAQKLLHAYDAENDIRFDAYFDHDPALVADGQLPDVIAKYAGADGAENRNDIKVFRTGEMYLVRAEAYTNLGRLQEAAEQLNTLRSKRIEGYEAETFTDAQALKAAIQEERYLELPFEGHRFFDLKRWGLPVNRLAGDTGDDGQLSLNPSAIYYYLPIPQAEILSNPNIRPNNNGW
ncbi:MAG: RagB/SusD family nutrient uptake outer membrane protein [Chitinophaga sp.]|uniref:RagB/SusD family nutrient uptake outer membrane protein n=1 Tax=Chitinophaga sp. TaxID=1869181 RepID=UPI0025C266C7|nr:RagB/SusD family nutrient uptake outer membrane protein [Chitinophaga sp.]MBV8253521.1 RagB/SusD family nutrient uptake outer membrane protein [Chitinophaga sp.]